MKNPLKNQATKLAKQISGQYNLLSIEDVTFFETYHDKLLIQKDCAWDAVGEVEYFESKKNHVDAKCIIKQLVKTLEYCRSIIKLQEATLALPKCIFV